MGGGPPTGETAEELAGEPPAIEEGGGEPGEEWRWNHHKRVKRLRRWMWRHRGDSGVEEVRAGDTPMNPTTATEGGKYAATRYSTLSKVEFLSPRV